MSKANSEGRDTAPLLSHTKMKTQFMQPSRSLWIPFLEVQEEILWGAGQNGRIEVAIGVTVTGGGKRNIFGILLQSGLPQKLCVPTGEYIVS